VLFRGFSSQAEELEPRNHELTRKKTKRHEKRKEHLSKAKLAIRRVGFPKEVYQLFFRGAVAELQGLGLTVIGLGLMI
jgi:hypothetical protein